MHVQYSINVVFVVYSTFQRVTLSESSSASSKSSSDQTARKSAMLTQRHHVCEPASRSACKRRHSAMFILTEEVGVDGNEDGAAVGQEDGGDAHVLSVRCVLLPR